MINGLVGIGWASGLIELVVIAGVAYGIYWLIRWLRAYVKNLPDPETYAERVREERLYKSRNDEK